MTFTSIGDLYPLSSLQRIWLANGRGARLPEHHKHLGWQYVGDLDLSRLTAAWRAVTNRHAALRSSFFWEGMDEPLQIVHHRVDACVVCHDLVGLTMEQQEARLAAELHDDHVEGFDLGSVPLNRLIVFKIARRSYRLVWSLAGPVVDSWSQPIVIKDLFRLYEGAQTDTLAAPPEYCDFVAWRSRCSFEGAEQLWRRELAQFRGLTSVCTRSGSGSVLPEHADQVVPVDFATFAKLESAAKAHHLTLNALVMGAWALVLARHCDVDFVVFGITLSGRSPSVPGIDRMVGFFMNILPVAAAIRPRTRFVDFAAQLQDFTQQAHRYEHLPADLPARWFGSGVGPFLFDSLFVFENYPVVSPGDAPLPEVDLRETQGIVVSGFPLTVIVSKGWEWLQMLYDVTCIDHVSVMRLQQSFSVCLRNVAANPTRSVGELSTGW